MPSEIRILSFGTFFSLNRETLQMQTVRGQKSIDTSQSGFREFSSGPVSSDQAKRLKIKEFISWSVCFGVIGGLTGILKFLKIGVTMESVTSILFYLSLAGLIFFISKIILITKNPVRLKANNQHELN